MVKNPALGLLVGWVFFFSGNMLPFELLPWKLVLLAAARVLPPALLPSLPRFAGDGRSGREPCECRGTLGSEGRRKPDARDARPRVVRASRRHGLKPRATHATGAMRGIPVIPFFPASPPATDGAPAGSSRPPQQGFSFSSLPLPLYTRVGKSPNRLRPRRPHNRS